MGQKQKSITFWRDHEEAFRNSGLTRLRYCRKHQISVYQFDYWRRRLKKLSENKSSADKKDWIPLQICEESPGKQNTGIRIQIGQISVEIQPGFNHKLLSEVLRIAGALC